MRVRNQFYRLMSPDPDPAAGGAPPAADPSVDPDPGPDPSPDPGAPPAAGASTWPDDWRTQIAGSDEKVLGRLSRYGSPKDMANALLSVQNRIGAGELRSALPKNPTAEQVTQWRSENGIPEAPDKYDLKLEGGLVIGTDDKPLMDNLLKAVHKGNGSSAVASEVVNFYYAEVERAEAARLEADKAATTTASDALHAEWGAEFRPNMNMIDGLLDTMPGGAKELFKYGRLSDGTPLMANAEVIRWLNTMAREINPVTTVIPNAGANLSGAIDDELKKIEGNMGAPKGSKEYKAYWDDPKQQARYRDLLDARERSSKKAA